MGSMCVNISTKSAPMLLSANLSVGVLVEVVEEEEEVVEEVVEEEEEEEEDRRK